MATRARKISAAAAIAAALAVAAEWLLPAPLAMSGGKFPRRISHGRLFDRADRGCRRFFRRPAASRYSIVHNPNWNAVALRDFSPRNVVVGHVDDCSVSGLSFSGSPSAVFRGVAEGVIFALYRKVVSVARALRPLKEGFKTEPFLANRYPFPSVVLVGEVAAPPKHVAPAVMDSGAFHPMRRRSFAKCGPRSFASAGSTFTASQVAADDYALCPAGALTQPQSRPDFIVASLFDNDPFAECKASHIDKSLVFHQLTPMVSV